MNISPSHEISRLTSFNKQQSLTTLIINAFTNGLVAGNPAAIIKNFIGTTEEMQNMAKQLNMPVTVFVLDPIKKQSDVSLRFFGKESELSMCGHGIIASATYIFAHIISNRNVIYADVNDGTTIQIIQNFNKIIQFITPRADKVELEFDKNYVCSLIGMSNQDVLDRDLPFCIGSIGSPKLLIPLLNRDIILSLKPDFASIRDWSIKNGVNGIYVYTKDTIDKNSDFFARSFNPKSGTNEDIATGVAAAALASLVPYKEDKDFIIEQGDNLGCPSRIIISVQEKTLKVGGSTLIVSKL